MYFFRKCRNFLIIWTIFVKSTRNPLFSAFILLHYFEQFLSTLDTRASTIKSHSQNLDLNVICWHGKIFTASYKFLWTSEKVVCLRFFLESHFRNIFGLRILESYFEKKLWKSLIWKSLIWKYAVRFMTLGVS